jgi:hypothetical protein
LKSTNVRNQSISGLPDSELCIEKCGRCRRSAKPCSEAEGFGCLRSSCIRPKNDRRHGPGDLCAFLRKDNLTRAGGGSNKLGRQGRLKGYSNDGSARIHGQRRSGRRDVSASSRSLSWRNVADERRRRETRQAPVVVDQLWQRSTRRIAWLHLHRFHHSGVAVRCAKAAATEFLNKT